MIKTYLDKRKEKYELLLAYKEVFGSERGQKVLLDMMKTFHFFSSSMSENPEETAFKEGERSVVLRILRSIEQDPSEIKKLMDEGQSKE